jgi:hypothetical protein
LGIRANPVVNKTGWFPLIIPTDDRPAVFFLTNPLNYLRNNVASGGEFGFWFSMPAKPNGLSLLPYANDTTVAAR